MPDSSRIYATPFPVYFRLAVPEGNISIVEVQTILALASNSQAFGMKLVELSTQIRPDGITRVQVFLDRLRDYVDKDISLDCIEAILQAFFEVGDQLRNTEDEKNYFDSISYEIERLINHLLERLEKVEREKILQRIVLNGHAIATIVQQVISLGSQHGKYESRRDKPEDQRILNTQQLEEIEKLALNKVRDAAQQENLLKAPNLRQILAFWRDLGNIEEVSQWVQEAIQKDQNLIYLLENFLTNIQGYRLDPRWLSPYLDIDKIVKRFSDLAKKNELTENQKIALSQFLKEYEMRQQGQNPNDPFP